MNSKLGDLLKFCLFGKRKVGKTNLLNSLLDIPLPEEYKETRNELRLSKEIEYNGKPYTFKGTEMNTTIDTMYPFQLYNIIAFVVDITDKSSYEKIEMDKIMIEETFEYYPLHRNTPFFIILVTKVDLLEDRKQALDEIKEIANKMSINDIFEVSTKTGEGIKELYVSIINKCIENIDINAQKTIEDFHNGDAFNKKGHKKKRNLFGYHSRKGMKLSGHLGGRKSRQSDDDDSSDSVDSEEEKEAKRLQEFKRRKNNLTKEDREQRQKEIENATKNFEFYDSLEMEYVTWFEKTNITVSFDICLFGDKSVGKTTWINRLNENKGAYINKDGIQFNVKEMLTDEVIDLNLNNNFVAYFFMFDFSNLSTLMNHKNVIEKIKQENKTLIFVGNKTDLEDYTKLSEVTQSIIDFLSTLSINEEYLFTLNSTKMSNSDFESFSTRLFDIKLYKDLKFTKILNDKTFFTKYIESYEQFFKHFTKMFKLGLNHQKESITKVDNILQYYTNKCNELTEAKENEQVINDYKEIQNVFEEGLRNSISEINNIKANLDSIMNSFLNMSSEYPNRKRCSALNIILLLAEKLVKEGINTKEFVLRQTYRKCKLHFDEKEEQYRQMYRDRKALKNKQK